MYFLILLFIFSVFCFLQQRIILSIQQLFNMGAQCSCKLSKQMPNEHQITHNTNLQQQTKSNINYSMEEDDKRSRDEGNHTNLKNGQKSKDQEARTNSQTHQMDSLSYNIITNGNKNDSKEVQSKANEKRNQNKQSSILINKNKQQIKFDQLSEDYNDTIYNNNNPMNSSKVGRKAIKKVVQLFVINHNQAQIVQENDAVQYMDLQFSKGQECQILKSLQNHFILSQFSKKELDYLVKKMRRVKLFKQRYIFKQGDPSHSYYVIVEGRCRVQIDGVIKKVIEGGSSFGDLGIIYNAPRSASIYSQKQCILAELNAKKFRKILSDLNAIYQRQNKIILGKLQFYNQLTQLQKNTLASNCITEIYQVGQVIFNKGDAANAFYLIQQGIVTILQKNIDLKKGDSVGVNAILSNQNQYATRSNTLIAKTSCKLLSLTRQIITNNLGGTVSNILRKNFVKKILNQSLIWDMYQQKQWEQMIDKLTITTYSEKGSTIFTKLSRIQPFNMYLLLKSPAKSKKNPKCISYIANSIIQQNKVYKKQTIIFDDDYQLDGTQAEVVKIVLLKQSQRKKQTRKDKPKNKSSENNQKQSKQNDKILESIQMKISGFNQIRKKPIDNINQEALTISAAKVMKTSSNFNLSNLNNKQDTFKRIKTNENVGNDKNQQISFSFDQLRIQDFVVLRRLRSGNFGKVYACYNRSTSKKYAIKVMNKSDLINTNVLAYVQREGQMLQQIPQHPFFVKFNQTLQASGLIMIVMELLEGQDLFDATNSRLPLRFRDYKFFISQIIMMIEHLHSCKIAYRDLKPENIMLNNDGYLKLIDLGTAKKLTIEQRFKTNTIIGTPHYMAPEIVLGKGYSFAVDWWSLGVIMYQMVCGRLPFGELLQDPFAVYQQVLKTKQTFNMTVNRSAQNVICRLLNKNNFKRLTNGSTQLKQMEFFKDIMWDKMLSKQYQSKLFPSKSSLIGAKQIEKCLSKKKNSALHIFLKDKQTKF